MPAHKNISYFTQFDLTELPLTDDLYNSCGPIKSSECLISSIYGSGITIFSAGGNTLCIQTMLHAANSFGDKIIIAKNAHKSAINAIKLLGLVPIWIDVDKYQNVLAKNIEYAIVKCPDISSVYITSPDYFGVMADIKAIKKICGKIPLLVDNAHGAHLKFIDKKMHPLDLGADLCADSAHKTLPLVLTGGAWLHVKNDFHKLNSDYIIKYRDMKESMAIFGSTSPSFLILMSLDRCGAWLVKNGEKKFKELANKVIEIKKIAVQAGFEILKNGDPTRITFDISYSVLESERFMNHMISCKVEPELIKDGKIVLIPSPFNSEKDFRRLKQAIISFKLK
jgi:arginine/lysine/ornithine decarboxylase